ncbi:MAG: tRNA pseudouridine(38-40) synthase TruA [Verrucomicrobiota bacterium]|nr:tRNA pseudouridine(38-40) synthase TruA [Verrucomicrobiota bacterium]
MSQRLKLILAYDGTPFAGWQSQPNGNAIQDHLERAFERVGGQRVRVHGAGRTDAGVHALAQCAHVDVTNERFPVTRWLAALNGVLPPTIRVLRCQRVSSDFHARFSATGKAYRYRIWSAPTLPPFEYGRAWHVIAPVDLRLMQSTAAQFVGRHNFGGFAANRGKKELNTSRTVHSFVVRRRGPCITLDIDGDGFLYKMARLMVGSLVQHASGKLPIEELTGRLSGRIGKARLVAPAGGLFLLRVRY